MRPSICTTWWSRCKFGPNALIRQYNYIYKHPITAKCHPISGRFFYCTVQYARSLCQQSGHVSHVDVLLNREWRLRLEKDSEVTVHITEGHARISSSLVLQARDGAWSADRRCGCLRTAHESGVARTGPQHVHFVCARMLGAAASAE